MKQCELEIVFMKQYELEIMFTGFQVPITRKVGKKLG